MAMKSTGKSQLFTTATPHQVQPDQAKSELLSTSRKPETLQKGFRRGQYIHLLGWEKMGQAGS
ncbi:hypothetical protein DY000_02037113 [Brassica cretica]|uniref:Uncharacterized protein n=1 Tax=Brassica cretica TaxID=69181 RepID=A0ABQ7BI77_BRACR|nr:hypothetical protein DY000_02037113 [Brassica cretica]